MASTIIGPNITIEGDVQSDDDVVVHGTIRGKLSAKEGVVIESGGQVEADITGGPLSIAGSVTGNVTSDGRVDLQPGARLIGNVRATRITIADGAQFKGSVDMDL